MPRAAYARRRMKPFHRLILCGSIVLAPACGGSRDALEQQLAELRSEVTRLRASQAKLTERIEIDEIDHGAFGKGAAPTPTAKDDRARPPDRDRPDLSVVRLSPSEGDGDADTAGQRPLVRAVGSEGSIQGKRYDKSSGSRPPAKKPPANPNKAPASEVRPTPQP